MYNHVTPKWLFRGLYIKPFDTKMVLQGVPYITI